MLVEVRLFANVDCGCECFVAIKDPAVRGEKKKKGESGIFRIKCTRNGLISAHWLKEKKKQQHGKCNNNKNVSQVSHCINNKM